MSEGSRDPSLEELKVEIANLTRRLTDLEKFVDRVTLAELQIINVVRALPGASEPYKIGEVTTTGFDHLGKVFDDLWMLGQYHHVKHGS